MNPVPGILLLGVLLWSAGCAVAPRVVVDGPLAWSRYGESYRLWSRAPRYWQVSGLMDLDSPETGGRRHRVTLAGRGWGRGKMAIQGPFQQVVAELWMDDDHIRLVDVANRQVLQAPADEEGLQRLAHWRLPPERMLQVVLGLAVPPGAMGEGHRWRSPQGETVQLDEQGRMVARSGETGSGVVYQAVYEWGSDREGMPLRVQLAMGEGHRLEFQWKEWRFPSDRAGEALLRFTAPEGFQWLALPERTAEP